MCIISSCLCMCGHYAYTAGLNLHNILCYIICVCVCLCVSVCELDLWWRVLVSKLSLISWKRPLSASELTEKEGTGEYFTHTHTHTHTDTTPHISTTISINRHQTMMLKESNNKNVTSSVHKIFD